MTEKKCKRCKETRDKSEFHKSKKNRDGLRRICIYCVSYLSQLTATGYRKKQSIYQKQCTRCKITKNLTDFPQNQMNKDWLDSWCKQCNVEQYQEWHYNNLEEARRKKLKWRYDNYEYARQREQNWTLNNPERNRQQAREWRQRNLEYKREHGRNWHRENPGKSNQNKAKRRAAKLNATPPWLSEEHEEQIRQFYENRPEGYHVDHIIPLQAEEACGLHVPWNLQLLPATDNLQKSNVIS